MVREEIIKRSPIRVLEKLTHGGAGKGNIGVFASRPGVGKTACLVHLGSDKLLQGKHVIHASFADDTRHISVWYEDIFREITRRNNLNSADTIHDEAVRNRVIMNFTQDGVHITEIEKSFKALIEQGNFQADAVLIDGYDFGRSSTEELQEFREFARSHGLEVWFTASVGDVGDGTEIPPELMHVADEISVAISLRPDSDYVHLTLVKDHDSPPSDDPDMHLKLDAKLLLIAEE